MKRKLGELKKEKEKEERKNFLMLKKNREEMGRIREEAQKATDALTAINRDLESKIQKQDELLRAQRKSMKRKDEQLRDAFREQARKTQSYKEEMEEMRKVFGEQRKRETLRHKMEIKEKDQLISVLEQKLQKKSTAVVVGKIKERDIHKIGKPIGSGAYGKVFEAKWNGEGGGILVCLKELNLNRSNVKLEDVERELQIMSKLYHPSITNLFGYYLKNNISHIVMELMETDLWSFIQKFHDKLSYYRLFQIMWNMAISVNYLSCVGIIHRDIRADNFLVSKDGKVVKITDFGIAKIKPQLDQTRVMTNYKGNPVWQPSECHGQGKLPYSARSDIYSLGMTFFQVIFKRLPFSGKRKLVEEYWEDIRTKIPYLKMTPKEIGLVFYAIPELVKKGERPETSNANVPKEFVKLLERMWMHDPKKRISCVELIKWFEKEKSNFEQNYSNEFFKVITK